MVNITSGLSNLKMKVDDLDVGKLDLKKLSDVVDNEVVKETKFIKLKTKANNLERKFLKQLS